MFEFQSYDGLIRLTIEVDRNTEGDQHLEVRRWYRGTVEDEWEEDGRLVLWPDDPVERMVAVLVPAWAAQARSENESFGRVSTEACAELEE